MTKYLFDADPDSRLHSYMVHKLHIHLIWVPKSLTEHKVIQNPAIKALATHISIFIQADYGSYAESSQQI